MKESTIDWSVPQRQSPAAVFIVLFKALLSILKFAWPLLLVYIFHFPSKRTDTWELVVLAVSGLTVISALLGLLFFWFSIVNNELVIKKGIFVRNTIVLPLRKIQAVHIDRTWLHKLFNTAQVSFDSAGSEKMEIKLSAVELKKAEALKEFIAGSGQPVAERSLNMPGNTILSLDTKDLLKLSISANHLEAFSLLLVFALSVVDNIEKALGGTRDLSKWSLEFAQGHTGSLLLVLIAGVLVISIAISVGRILLLYLDFRVTRSEKGLHVHSGMINAKEKLVPFRKIQFISWKANWLRHKMKLYLMNFHTTGSDEVKQKQQVKVPVTRSEFIPRLVQYYHALLPLAALTPLRVQRAYIFRKVLFAVIAGAVLSGAGFLFFRYHALFFLLLIPLTALHSWLFRRKFRLWAHTGALQVKKGIYGVEELILKWNNIQTVRLQQSLYQQRKQLATVKLYTAGGIIVIPYIMHGQAMAIVNYALYKIESDTDPWM